MTAIFSLEELKLLEAYYGVLPALLAGIEYICNAECKPFLVDLMETTADLTSHQPVRVNLPYGLVHVVDLFKVRALRIPEACIRLSPRHKWI